MAQLNIRNLPDSVRRALQTRAAQNGRSLDAEVCAILTLAAKPAERVRVGDALATMGRQLGVRAEGVVCGPDLGRQPAEPFTFE